MTRLSGYQHQCNYRQRRAEELVGCLGVEIEKLYRAHQGCLEIAKLLQQLGYAQGHLSDRTIRSFVEAAVAMLIPDPEERWGIREEIRKQNLRDAFGKSSNFDVAHCRRVARERHQKRPLTQTDVRRMIAGKGERTWATEEWAWLSALVAAPEYQHRVGRNSGRPDYGAIAQTIAAETGLPERSINAVRCYGGQLFRAQSKG